MFSESQNAEIQKTERGRRRLTRLMRDFLDTEASGGVIMLLFAIFAAALANHYITADLYQTLLKTKVGFAFGEGGLVFPLKQFAKDVLMVVFFLLVGAELKREMTEGFLSKKGQKILPLFAAAGGVIFPSLIYLFLNRNSPELLQGWAIPSATDIAFAVGVLAIVGKNVPPAAKVFLLAIAIYDDLAAIIIVALFFGQGFSPEYAVISIGIIGILFLFNRMKTAFLFPYLLGGIALAVTFQKTGLHPTVAGVVTAFFIPIRISENNSTSPLGTLIHFLHPYVAYGILPIFAFVSAGVSFAGVSIDLLFTSLPLGIAAGLFFGKQIGVFALTYISVKLGIADKPEGASWKDIYVVSILAGIGFTMSLFIGLLAFSDPVLQSEVKIGVIAGSILSALWAIIFIRVFMRKQK